MTPEPTEGFTVEFTPAAGPRRRHRFEPRGDGLFWRIESECTGCSWRETGREPVDLCRPRRRRGDAATRVQPRPLPELPVVALHALEDDPEVGIHAGEVLGYCCLECGQADETLTQILHLESCDLAGNHGRRVYGDELPSVEAGSPAVLDPDHPITKVDWGVTNRAHDIRNGVAAMFRCDGCGNADENLFEIQHDEGCDLTTTVDEDGKTQVVLVHSDEIRAVADGGEPAG